MTVEEKRKLVFDYCKKTNCSFAPCVLTKDDWTHKANSLGGEKTCLSISCASERELDEALRLIKKEESEKGAALGEAQVKELERAAAVIQLEVKDNSPMQLASAIRDYIWEYYSPDYELALIAMDELTEHIEAYVRAERKALEYKKLTGEGCCEL